MKHSVECCYEICLVEWKNIVEIRERRGVLLDYLSITNNRDFILTRNHYLSHFVINSSIFYWGIES